MEMSATAQLLREIGDVSVVIIIAGSSILIRQLVSPFHRGFFKDDESLMYPFHKGSSIPAFVLYGVGFCLPVFVMMVTEGVLLRQRQRKVGISVAGKAGGFWRAWLWMVYKLSVIFFFGAAVTHFSTNVPKYTIGRLRPHFFAVCVPDPSRLSNMEGYIEEDVCTGNNTADIEEARVSFPSGHSSMAVYCMLFVVLYLERRFTWSCMVLLKSFLQVLVSLMAMYTCLSRVSDYKHHWSDVLAGAILGTIIVGFTFWSLEKNVLSQLWGTERKADDAKPPEKPAGGLDKLPTSSNPALLDTSAF